MMKVRLRQPFGMMVISSTGLSDPSPSRWSDVILLVLLAAVSPWVVVGETATTKLPLAPHAEQAAASDLLRAFSSLEDILVVSATEQILLAPVGLRQHLVDRPLRTVLHPDPFQACQSLWHPKRRPATTRRRRILGEERPFEQGGRRDRATTAYTVKQLTWGVETAHLFTRDATLVVQTFQDLHDVQHALSQLRLAWMARQRELVLRQRAQAHRELRRQQKQHSRSQQSSVATLQRKKVPRRTLLSNITDYDQDLEDDFFSELIEQVRLPTFTLEEYYEDEEDNSEEADDEIINIGIPTAPIYSRRELQRELDRVRLSRLQNVLAGVMPNVPYPYEAVKGGADSSSDAVWFSFSAIGPHWTDDDEEGGRHMRISTVVIKEPQCPIEDLQVTPVDEVTHKRYQRALERLWQLHAPYQDPVLHSFQQVPFPHCNVGDLQVMAMDVLHKRRSHHLAQRWDRYDPALRVVGFVYVPTPVCDVANLKIRPLDEVVEKWRLHSATRPTEPLGSQSATTIHPPQKASWADALLRRRQAREDGPREDWPTDEVESLEAEDLVLMPEEPTSPPRGTIEATEAIVSTALRTERANAFHPFQVSRGDSARHWGSSSSNGYFDPDSVLDEGDEAVDEKDGTIHDNPAVRLSESLQEAFEFVVPKTSSQERTETRLRKRRRAAAAASTASGEADDPKSLEAEGIDDAAYMGMEHAMAGDSTEDSDVFAEVDQAQLELHLHVEDELYRIEMKLRDVQQELARLKKMRSPQVRSENLNARDISILRDGCDWTVLIDDFESIEGVELLWHSFRDSEASLDDMDDDQLLNVEVELLREYNAAEAFAQ